MTIVTPLFFVGIAQSQSLRNSNAREDSSLLIQKVKSGDPDAIAEAGRSGNKAYVPYLRKQLTSARYKGTNLSPATQSRMALAKLGEVDQLEDLWCNVTYSYPAPLGQLSYVGGWYSVRVLKIVLNAESDRVFERRARKQEASDVVYPPDSANALKTLTAMFPNGPRGSPEQWLTPTDRQNSIQQWNKWIADHTDELKKLEPSGDNVDLSIGACRDGKPKRKGP
jgi:hypothetical protein